ncbi:hypothetical protein TIFTF001_047282 [Ficus carica]|uniref:Uncharacterized protein n=1 Tax=Ficus carica TaxID=3494 RepID=A0AA87Z4I1_FICCA|nr:hypothetical protein TIFTF001_047282 [Ficus carica]
MASDPLYSKPRWVNCSPTFPCASASSISSSVREYCRCPCRRPCAVACCQLLCSLLLHPIHRRLLSRRSR